MFLVVPVRKRCRILIYARYSTDEQRQQSILDQIDYCREFLDEQGVSLASVETLSDEGISGELTRIIHSLPVVERVEG
jgi:hypothetical protein